MRTLGGEHRDRLREAVDYNRLSHHCNKIPSEIQKRLRLRNLSSLFDNPTQPVPRMPAPSGCGDLGRLVDQALFRYQHHKEIADYHAAEAEKHKAVLDELSRLVPARRYR